MAIKTHKVTLSLDNPRVIQSGINVQSFDKQSIQISIELTKNDEVFQVPSDATIRVSLLKLARQEQKIIVDVPNTNRESIDWIVPDYLDGYQGVVRVGVYLVSGTENVDLGYFTILSNVSDIDKMADEFVDNVFQGWEQIEADLNELNLTIAQTKLDLADDLAQVDSAIANINAKNTQVDTLTSNFADNVATKQADVTSKYNAFDADITEANQTIDDILALLPKFQAVLDETTGKDVISAPEIILARNGEANLKSRLDKEKQEVTAQLAQNEQFRLQSYITPYDFGAVGDGIADDTEALRRAIYESNQKGTILFFPSGCKCLVTDSLNVYNGEYYDVVLNMLGSLPKARGVYALNEHGGIKLNSVGALFKNATVSGSISNMSIIGKRDEQYYFFDNCKLSRLIVDSNNITQFGAFLYDSSVSNVSRINENTFLTVFYFHKHNTISKSLTDSFITNNYINGGVEVTDNACFEFDSGNGSVIQGNFIDYYHTIYRTKTTSSNQMATSIGNHYQVFLYFYKFKVLNAVTFVSIGDTFNWTNKSSLDHLKEYVEETYQDENGAIYSIPTYIFRPMENSEISIQSGYIQSNVGNIVYLDTGTVQYKRGNATAHFVNVDRYDSSKITTTKKRSSKPFYNFGSYMLNKSDPFFVIPVDNLPSVSESWMAYPTGTRVMFENEEYRLVSQFNSVTQTMKATWVKVAVT